MSIDLPIFVDIDGTLTNEPHKKWGRPYTKRIHQLRTLISQGNRVVLWSGGGQAYAEQWAATNNLDGAICMGKPRMIVDDCPTIRPVGRMPVLSPSTFFGPAPPGEEGEPQNGE